MIKVKNEIFNDSDFYEAIRKINAYDGFSMKDAYQMNVLTKELISKATDFEQMRVKLLDKYGTKDEKNNVYTFEKEGAEKFRENLKELLDIQIKLNVNKIKIPMDLKLSPSQLRSIESLFDFSDIL